jgi:hypothetical protein
MQLGDKNLGALAIRSPNSIAQPRELHAGLEERRMHVALLWTSGRAASKHLSTLVIGERCTNARGSWAKVDRVAWVQSLEPGLGDEAYSARYVIFAWL